MLQAALASCRRISDPPFPARPRWRSLLDWRILVIPSRDFEPELATGGEPVALEYCSTTEYLITCPSSAAHRRALELFHLCRFDLR
jgi:hypothetical protein